MLKHQPAPAVTWWPTWEREVDRRFETEGWTHRQHLHALADWEIYGVSREYLNRWGPHSFRGRCCVCDVEGWVRDRLVWVCNISKADTFCIDCWRFLIAVRTCRHGSRRDPPPLHPRFPPDAIDRRTMDFEPRRK